MILYKNENISMSSSYAEFLMDCLEDWRNGVLENIYYHEIIISLLDGN